MGRASRISAFRRLVLLYVARLLRDIAERAAARAREHGSVATDADASEYVGTGAASSPPPPAWLQRVLKARARMRRHTAPRRSGGESRSVEVGMNTPAIRPTTPAAPFTPAAAPAERIHLAVPRREPTAVRELLPQRERAALRVPATTRHNDQQQFPATAVPGDQVPATAAARSPLRPQARIQVQPLSRHHASTPYAAARAEQSERSPQLRPATNAVSSVARNRPGEPSVQNAPSPAANAAPLNTLPETLSRPASGRMSRRPPQGGDRMGHPSGPSPEPDAVGADRGIDALPWTLPEPRMRSWLAEEVSFQRAHGPTRADEPTPRFPATMRAESSRVDRHTFSSAELPWPSLPHADHEPANPQLLLREWNRLERIRAEQRGRSWNG